MPVTLKWYTLPKELPVKLFLKLLKYLKRNFYYFFLPSRLSRKYFPMINFN